MLFRSWTATSRPPKVFSQDRIDGCDLCILLIGRRRGHRPEGEERSITQMEYDYAVEAGLDVLVFKLDDNSPWQTDWDERKTDPALGEWIAALMERHGVELFEQPCAAGDWEATVAVAQASPVPMMLDESIYGLADIDRAGELEIGRAHV